MLQILTKIKFNVKIIYCRLKYFVIYKEFCMKEKDKKKHSEPEVEQQQPDPSMPSVPPDTRGGPSFDRIFIALGVCIALLIAAKLFGM